MAGDDHLRRLTELAEVGEARAKSKDGATGWAAVVALAFFAFVGYCAWSYMHDRANDQAAAAPASSGSRP